MSVCDKWGNKLGDTLQRQIAVCVPRNFCENLVPTTLFSSQQVAQILSVLFDFEWLVAATNSIAETDLHKNSPVHEAICHGNLLSQRAAANCCQVCSTFKSFGAPSRHPLTVTMYVEMLKLHEVAASTWWSWMILLRIEMRGNSADK